MLLEGFVGGAGNLSNKSLIVTDPASKVKQVVIVGFHLSFMIWGENTRHWTEFFLQ